MEFSRRADLPLLGERALRNQGRPQQTENAVDRVTLGRSPFAQPMSLADRSNVLRYRDFPYSKYPPSNKIHGQKDVDSKVAPGTQLENLERHEALAAPTRRQEDLNSQRIGMDLKHRRDLKSEGKWFEDTLFRRDEILARRIEALGIKEEDYPVIGLDNAAAYHTNDDFVQSAQNILTGNFRQAVLAADRLVNGAITEENPLPGLPLPRNQATQLLRQRSQRQNGDVPLPTPLPRGQATFRRENVKIETTGLALEHPEPSHLTSPESGSEGLVLRAFPEESPADYNFRESRTRKVRRSRPGREDAARHGDVFGTRFNSESDPIDLDLTLSRMPSTQKSRFPKVEVSPHTSTQRGLENDSDNRNLHPDYEPIDLTAEFEAILSSSARIEVRNLPANVTEDELRSFFQSFGRISRVIIPRGRGSGFVKFIDRDAAQMALDQMQGYLIGGSRVHLRWAPESIENIDRLSDLPSLDASTVSVALYDDEDDKKAADPTIDYDDMFITYTISEDRTGNQEGITRKRLAALGARCVLRMSRPQVEELLITKSENRAISPKSDQDV